MSEWEPTERRPREPMDDGEELPPTEAIPGQGGPPEELPIVPMSDEEPPPSPPAVEPEAFEPTVVMPPGGGQPPAGGPPTPGPPPPPEEPWYRRRGPLAAVIGVGLALIFLLIAFLIWVNDEDDQIATTDSSTTSSSTSSSTSSTSTSLATTTTGSTTTSSTSTSTSSTSSTTTTLPPTTAPPTTAAPTTQPPTTPAPTNPPPTTTTIPAVTVPPSPQTTLWDIVRASPDLSRLEELVQQAGLVDAIDAADPITLFAPSDAAFELLEVAPGGSELLDDPAQLENLLLGHVVDGQALTADDVFQLDSIEVSNGEVWTVDPDGQTVDGAAIPVADVEGANGFLHVVDKVLGT